jgi:hypothetical protein
MHVCTAPAFGFGLLEAPVALSVVLENFVLPCRTMMSQVKYYMSTTRWSSSMACRQIHHQSATVPLSQTRKESTIRPSAPSSAAVLARHDLVFLQTQVAILGLAQQRAAFLWRCVVISANNVAVFHHQARSPVPVLPTHQTQFADARSHDALPQLPRRRRYMCTVWPYTIPHSCRRQTQQQTPRSVERFRRLKKRMTSRAWTSRDSARGWQARARANGEHVQNTASPTASSTTRVGARAKQQTALHLHGAAVFHFQLLASVNDLLLVHAHA